MCVPFLADLNLASVGMQSPKVACRHADLMHGYALQSRLTTHLSLPKAGVSLMSCCRKQ